MLAVNAETGEAINKSCGDLVRVTLYRNNTNKEISQKEILDTFQDAGVLHVFEKLEPKKQIEIFNYVSTHTNEENRVSELVKWMEKLFF